MSLLYYFYCIYCREKLVTPKHVDMTMVNRLQKFIIGYTFVPFGYTFVPYWLHFRTLWLQKSTLWLHFRTLKFNKLKEDNFI